MRPAAAALVLLLFGWFAGNGLVNSPLFDSGIQSFNKTTAGFMAAPEPDISRYNDAGLRRGTEPESDFNGGAASAYQSAGRPANSQKIREVNERFTYEVRYGIFRLGTVYVYLLGDTVYHDTKAVHMVTEMVSNRRLPLIGYKESHYHNFLAWNDTIPYGLRFWQNSLHRDIEERYVYDFNYSTGWVYSYEEGELIDSLELDRPADSGPAVMYYSRLFAGRDLDTSYPIYVDNEKSRVEMNFTSRKEPYNSPAFPDENVRAYFMTGNAEFEGPFGFSGEFSAYFKDDELRIPLEARVSIWLGSVRVRLIEYERLN